MNLFVKSFLRSQLSPGFKLVRDKRLRKAISTWKNDPHYESSDEEDLTSSVHEPRSEEIKRTNFGVVKNQNGSHDVDALQQLTELARAENVDHFARGNEERIAESNRIQAGGSVRKLILNCSLKAP